MEVDIVGSIESEVFETQTKERLCNALYVIFNWSRADWTPLLCKFSLLNLLGKDL